MIKLGQHRDFDGAGLREYLVFVQEKLLPSRKIFDGNAHYAIKIAVDVSNLGFQLVPKHLLFSGASLIVRSGLRRSHRGQD